MSENNLTEEKKIEKDYFIFILPKRGMEGGGAQRASVVICYALLIVGARDLRRRISYK